MYFLRFVPFLFISMHSASILPKDCLQFKEKIVQLEAMQFSFSNLINTFYYIRNFYNNIDDTIQFEETEKQIIASKFQLNISRYQELIKNYYRESPIECLQAVRSYGNFEFLYFFTGYIIIEEDTRKSFILDALVKFRKKKDWNERFQRLRYDVLINFGTIAKRILLKPFRPTPQAQFSDSKIPLENSYNAIDDWRERKEILKELVLSLESFCKLVGYLKDDRFPLIVREKIQKYKFIINSFQVDLQGPSYSHFISVFYQLRRLSLIKYNDYYPAEIKRIFSVFGIYSKHMREYQFTDPSQFPKSMLAIIPRRLLTKESIMELFKCQTNDLISRSLQSMEIDQLSEIYYKTRKLRIGKFRNINFHNLLTLSNILTPQEEWIVRVYLFLLG
jgi:hypothetical protein